MHMAFDDVTAERLLSTKPEAAYVPNVLTTLMRHPGLAGPFLAYNQVLLSHPTLEPRLRELMVLRVARRTRSPYEWVQHVRLARRVGITAAEIDAIATDPDAHQWSSVETDLLAATDQLLDRYRIDDETWARLAGQLDERQLIEIAFVVGTYSCLAMAFNSIGLELDPELHSVPAPTMPSRD
jgi:AhpD family alkylhydroperoxidase